LAGILLGGEATVVRKNMTIRDFVTFFSIPWWKETFQVHLLV